MKFQIIVLRDLKANCFKPPMFVPNINAAIRDLTDMVNNPEGKEDWQRHPEDFELLHCGEWDHETGEWKYLSELGEPTDFKQLCHLSTLKAN